MLIATTAMTLVSACLAIAQQESACHIATEREIEISLGGGVAALQLLNGDMIASYQDRYVVLSLEHSRVIRQGAYVESLPRPRLFADGSVLSEGGGFAPVSLRTATGELVWASDSDAKCGIDLGAKCGESTNFVVVRPTNLELRDRKGAVQLAIPAPQKHGYVDATVSGANGQTRIAALLQVRGRSERAIRVTDCSGSVLAEAKGADGANEIFATSVDGNDCLWLFAKGKLIRYDTKLEPAIVDCPEGATNLIEIEGVECKKFGVVVALLYLPDTKASVLQISDPSGKVLTRARYDGLCSAIEPSSSSPKDDSVCLAIANSSQRKIILLRISRR